MSVRRKRSCFTLVVTLLIGAAVSAAPASGRLAQMTRSLRGLDARVQQLMREWNAAGVAVGVVVGDELVLARGYGYRDYGRKLPMTPQTLFPIGSNTKLFTAVAAGLLVEEGKLSWDRPVRQFVPQIEFHDDALNAGVTLRDMLSHRTGISRHDTVWYEADLTPQEVCARLKFLEPSAPLRQTFLYSNLMYGGVGCVVERLSGQPWGEFVKARILDPLEMRSTRLSIPERLEAPDHAVGYSERRNGAGLYPTTEFQIPEGVAPAGALVSNLEDLSHWMIALMNEGRYAGGQILSSAVLKATSEPSMARVNAGGETRGWWESLNPVAGMGRNMASYRGHLLSFHTGGLTGFHSQISFMPLDRIGIIVLVIGDQAASLPGPISYGIYERALGLSPTPWSQRLLGLRQEEMDDERKARVQQESARVAGTTPAHALQDYVGEYEHPAYGLVTIIRQQEILEFAFHRVRRPLQHFHYERFDTVEDERERRWSLSFATGPRGDVDRLTMSLDGEDVVFIRRRLEY